MYARFVCFNVIRHSERMWLMHFKLKWLCECYWKKGATNWRDIYDITCIHAYTHTICFIFVLLFLCYWFIHSHFLSDIGKILMIYELIDDTWLGVDMFKIRISYCFVFRKRQTGAQLITLYHEPRIKVSQWNNFNVQITMNRRQELQMQIKIRKIDL